MNNELKILDEVHQMTLNAKEIARYIDHTLLKPDASTAAIHKLCEEAAQHQFFSVCVNSQFVAQLLKPEGTGVKVAAVVGFPLGASLSEVKAFEAAKAVENGAAEIDTVLPIGLLLKGNRMLFVRTLNKLWML